MRRLAVLLAVAGWLSGSLACRSVETPEPGISLILEGFRVVDIQTGKLLDDHCVEIAGERIRSVAPCTRRLRRDADETKVVEGGGLYLIPGLWDMHVHLTDATEPVLPQLVASGVTTVRDMGGDLPQLDAWRGEIEAGRRVGPRIFRSGPVVDGPKPDAPHRLTVVRPDEARSAVAALSDQGVDFIKIHNAVPREAYFALLAEARSRGIEVVGHVPASVSPIEAVEAGQASIEHVATIFEGTFAARFSSSAAMLEGIESFPDAGAAELGRSMISNGTAFTPTLVAYASRARRAELAAHPDPRRAHVARSLLEQWDRFYPVSAKDADAEVIAARDRAYRAWVRTVSRLHREGVPVLAGTDLGARDVYPDSLHDELAALADAGFSPLEALQAATLVPARFLEANPSAGTLAVGALADLVVLGANPLEDVHATRKIVAVIARGKYHDRQALDALRAARAF